MAVVVSAMEVLKVQCVYAVRGLMDQSVSSMEVMSVVSISSVMGTVTVPIIV